MRLLEMQLKAAGIFETFDTLRARKLFRRFANTVLTSGIPTIFFGQARLVVFVLLLVDVFDHHVPLQYGSSCVTAVALRAPEMHLIFDTLCQDHFSLIGLVTVSLLIPLGWWTELQLTCSPG